MFTRVSAKLQRQMLLRGAYKLMSSVTFLFVILKDFFGFWRWWDGTLKFTPYRFALCVVLIAVDAFEVFLFFLKQKQKFVQKPQHWAFIQQIHVEATSFWNMGPLSGSFWLFPLNSGCTAFCALQAFNDFKSGLN